jgi:hypothetical protein
MTRGKSQALLGRRIPSNSIPLLTSFDARNQQAHVLYEREKIARFLRMFSSPRKRLGLTPDEILIFFAIGYLSTSVSNDLIQMTPISYADVALLLGIPKETVRRKTIRLVDIDYVRCSSKGIFVKQLEIWCQMLERAI